jgi:hypothetical protein
MRGCLTRGRPRNPGKKKLAYRHDRPSCHRDAAFSSECRSISFFSAFTLLGVAIFHRHTLRVALTGLVAIALYKIFFTGFKTGPGATGLLFHLGHEWVILANLFCLLTGFALLSRHFEKSHVPVVLPKVPAARLEGRLS